MTISIPTVTKTNLTAFHSNEDGVQGYRLSVGVTSVFLAEADADALARYMLFAEPATPSPQGD